MKKIKLLPAVACLGLLVGCSNVPDLKDKNGTVVPGSESYQDIFEDLYNKSGVDTSVKEMLVRIAEYVLGQSDFYKDEVDDQVTLRTQEKFNDFYNNDSYQDDGLFDEEKLVQYLRGEGFNIQLKQGKTSAYKETIEHRVNNAYDDLNLDDLSYDYTEYTKSLRKDFVIDMMKEEYVRVNKAESSTSFYKLRDIREVSYFKFEASDVSDESEYIRKFKNIINENEVKTDGKQSFEDLVGSFEKEYKIYKLKQLAKDFALINAKAGVANPDFPLPEGYDDVLTYEASIKNNEDYGYKDIKDSDLEKEEVEEVETKLSEYSNSGAHSIYKGYYEKQLEILTASYMTEVVYTSETGNCIDSTVSDALEDYSQYTIGSDDDKVTTNFIDVKGNGSPCYMSGTTFYVIYATKLAADGSFNDDKDSEIKALRKLVNVSSYSKKCIEENIQKLADDEVFSVHNQDIFDYLEETYNFEN